VGLIALGRLHDQDLMVLQTFVDGLQEVLYTMLSCLLCICFAFVSCYVYTLVG